VGGGRRAVRDLGRRFEGDFRLGGDVRFGNVWYEDFRFGFRSGRRHPGRRREDGRVRRGEGDGVGRRGGPSAAEVYRLVVGVGGGFFQQAVLAGQGEEIGDVLGGEGRVELVLEVVGQLGRGVAAAEVQQQERFFRAEVVQLPRPQVLKDPVVHAEVRPPWRQERCAHGRVRPSRPRAPRPGRGYGRPEGRP